MPDDKPHSIRNIWRRPGSTWAGVGLIVMAIGIVGENNGLPLTWWDGCVFGGACFAAAMGALGR